MLIKRFALKDLKQLEFELEGLTILDVFKTSSIYGLVELIRIGNFNIDTEQAAMILQDYLDEGHTLVEAFKEVRDQLFPPDASGENRDQEAVEHFDSLTDMYNKYSLALAQAGMSISEFWDLETYVLYFWIDKVNAKLTADVNRQLQMSHTQAALIGAAFCGKLPHDAPKIKDTSRDNDLIEYNGKTMTLAQFKVMQSLEATNKRLNREEDSNG